MGDLFYLLPKEMASKDEANALFRLINARHGDPKISGLTHPFRAVGFKNRKPKTENRYFTCAAAAWLPSSSLPI